METRSERRLRKLRDLCERFRAQGGLQYIADEAGLNPNTLDQVLKGVLLPARKSDGARSPRKLGDDAAARMESAPALGLQRGWFDADDLPSPTVLLDFFTGKHGPLSLDTEPEDTTKRSGLHILSLDISTVPPPTPWETLMSTPELPHRFAALMPDDSIDEVVMRGTYLAFDRSLKPRPGDKILARCLGQLHIRIYEQTVDGWVARATRRGYTSFSSADTELVAVVSMTGRNPD